MSALTADIVDSVVAACQAGAVEAAEAFSRALGGDWTLSVGQPTTWSNEARDGLHGGGLALEFRAGDAAAIALLPSASGLLPDWVQSPDVTGVNKLDTLALELGELLLAEAVSLDNSRTRWMDDLATAVAIASSAADAQFLPLELASGAAKAKLLLIWPIAAEQIFGDLSQQPADEADAAQTESPAAPQRHRLPYRPTDYAELPPYARHLLKVKVPVVVKLVSKKKSVREITQLVPGSIISFDKPCDAPLELLVNDRPAAVGETVKVGERFGLQISELTLPPERFVSVDKRPSS